MTRLAGPGVSIIGSGSGCGKTWHSVGLLSALHRRGFDPAPFKAVAVLDPEDGTSFDDRPWARAIHHHLVAAGVPFSPDLNPLVVLPHSASVGTLYVRGDLAGEVRLLGPDQINFDELTDDLYERCVDAVESSLASVRKFSTFVVLEGAGDASIPRRRADVGNAVPATSAQFPVVAVYRPDRSHIAVLGEFAHAIPQGIWGLTRGVVLNDPLCLATPPLRGEVRGVPVMTMGHRQLPESDGSLAGQRRRTEALGKHIWASLPWDDWLAA
jgi:cobyric acid synthase